MPTWILPDDLCQIPNNRMLTAKNVNKNFEGTVPLSLLDYSQVQTATINRVEFTIFHYQVLDVVYGFGKVPALSQQESIVRAEMNAIVLNLLGALDCIAHEINILYDFKIDEKDVAFGHRDFNQNNCIICRLTKINLEVGNYLDQIVNNDTFREMKEYRNHIHRRLPVIQMSFSVGSNCRKITLPNDPSNYNPQLDDYSKNLEIQKYCKDLIDNFIEIIETYYQKMLPKINQYIEEAKSASTSKK